MGVFDWFRRNSASRATDQADSPEPNETGSVGTLVADRPATEPAIPAQKTAAEESDGETGTGGADGKVGADPISAAAPQPPGAGGESEGEQDMGLLDSIKEKLAPHHDKVEKGVDKAADMVDKKTGGKYGDQIDKGAEKAKDTLAQDEAAPAPEAPPAGEVPGEVPPEQGPRP
ncbi:MAG TPA: antitoxin [Yinghuangia sp.]|nr:antitoxin [Yinghuangia sp.]